MFTSRVIIQYKYCDDVISVLFTALPFCNSIADIAVESHNGSHEQSHENASGIFLWQTPRTSCPPCHKRRLQKKRICSSRQTTTKTDTSRSTGPTSPVSISMWSQAEPRLLLMFTKISLLSISDFLIAIVTWSAWELKSIGRGTDSGATEQAGGLVFSADHSHFNVSRRRRRCPLVSWLLWTPVM